MLLSRLRQTFAACLVATLAACASGPKAPEQAEVQIPKQYSRAQVTDIAVVLLDVEPDDNRLTEKKALEAKLPTVLQEVIESAELKVDNKESGKPVDLVRLKLNVKYDPGNRALRWVAGFTGAGKGTVQVQADAFDGATGALIATKRIESSKRMGILGGNFYDDIESAVEEAADDVLETVAVIPKRVP